MKVPYLDPDNVYSDTLKYDDMAILELAVLKYHTLLQVLTVHFDYE